MMKNNMIIKAASAAIIAGMLFSRPVALADGGTQVIREAAHVLLLPTEFDLGTMREGVSAHYDIKLKNQTDKVINILKVKASCGCTVVESPMTRIEPWGEVELKASIDTRGKIGRITKFIDIYTDASEKSIEIKLTGVVEHRAGIDKVDKSGIFKEGCKHCHLGANAGARKGMDLYNAVCYVCHKRSDKIPMNGRGAIGNAITNGVDSTSMPGFGQASGGPLSSEQIESLIQYLIDARGKDGE